MKKVFVVILIVVLVMSTIVGCAKPAEQSASEQKSEKKAEKVEAKDEEKSGVRMFEGETIYMIAEQQTPTIALSNQLDKFEELTGIKVELEMVPMDASVQKVTLALQSGTGAYDVIAMPYQFLGNLVVNEYIQPLEPLMENESLSIIDAYEEADIIQGMWEASGQWKDNIYGVAANSCIQFFAYRKDLFADADEQAAFKAAYGYDLAVPKDWDVYKDIAEFFTRSKGETLAGEKLEQNFYGVTMAGKRHDATTCEWLNYAWSFGGGVFDDAGNLIMDSEENIAALKYYNDLQQFAPPGVASKTWDEKTTDMQQGVAAMSVIFNDCAPGIEDPESSKVVGKMGYDNIPEGKGPAAHYGAWSYFIPSDSKSPEAAWVFLQWFNTTDVQKAIALDGGFPNLVSVYEDPDLNSLTWWEGSLKAYEISSTRPRIPEWNDMNEELMLQLSSALVGEITEEEALANAQESYEDILEGQLPLTYQ
jgi:multiple sugar transport system substrate-binding protein